MGLLNDLKEGIDRLRYYVSRGEIPVEELVSPDALRRVKRYPINIERWGEKVLFNYNNLAQVIPASCWTPLLRVCRGTILSVRGELISFPYHKFFNLNECDETSADRVWQQELLSITEKIDGVLVQAVNWRGEHIWASRHNFLTPPARTAMRIFGDSPIPEGYTLLFEIVAPQFRQKTMIDYCTTALWYLGCRDLSSFALYQGLPVWGLLPPTVKTNTTYFADNISEFVERILSRSGEQYEGVVIQSAEEEGNLLVKVKGIEYIRRVRLIRGVTNKRVMEMYEELGVEAIVAKLPGEVIDDHQIAALIRLIQDTEQQVLEEIADVKRRGIEPREITDERKRWMAGKSPEKYVRKYVRRQVEQML